MAIGQRIKFFRNRKGMTQKQLGEILGFLGKTSDVRMAQYESEARIPKQELVNEMAQLLEVSPHALTVPDIDTYVGLMHTLFALEDMYGLKIGEIEGEVCLRLDKSNHSYLSMFDMLHAWQTQAARLENGEISKEEYDTWRYRYPELDTFQIRKKVPSQEIGEITEAFLPDTDNDFPRTKEMVRKEEPKKVKKKEPKKNKKK
ncbi:MAG: helix-turn-helix domain-containing protein [Lachnospiraceae bacterium]|nr:helix-turn-helix domain-containing protein [Lachnospiraceae bacterium]